MATTTERLDREVANLNKLPGHIAGADCPLCKNKGVVYYRTGLYVVGRTCQCMATRKARHRCHSSGLAQSLEQCTFARFQCVEPWQKAIKDSALRFLQDDSGAWFFAGGQAGAGKTHICTAIVGELLRRGREARYMLWKDEGTWLKAHVNDEGYEPRIRELKTVPVLYIDDFFKTALCLDERGRRVRKPPTPGDINVAFEILNARYVNRLTTLLTSERLLDELLDCDEAIGSRIYERSRDYAHNLSWDRGKNWRLRA